MKVTGTRKAGAGANPRCPICKGKGTVSLPIVGRMDCTLCEGVGRLDAGRLAWCIEGQRKQVEAAERTLARAKGDRVEAAGKALDGAKEWLAIFQSLLAEAKGGAR